MNIFMIILLELHEWGKDGETRGEIDPIKTGKGKLVSSGENEWWILNCLHLGKHNEQIFRPEESEQLTVI